MPSSRTASNVRTKLSPPEVAARLGVSADKVLTWVRSGELRACNMATRRDGRPRWRIDVADLEAFEEARTAQPRPASAKRRRRQSESGVIQFF